MIYVLAHRGDSAHCPPNTLAAFRRAVEVQADGIECDLRVTKDGVMVICHDETIDATSTGTGKISEMDFQTLRKEDFGSWFGPQYAGEKLPTLEEMLEIVKDLPYLNIEIKDFGVNKEENIDRFYDMLKKYGCFERTMVSCFDMDLLDDLKKRHPDVRIGFLYVEKEQVLDVAKEHGCTAIHPYLQRLEKETVDKAVSQGLEVNIWTADSEEEIQKCIDLGCTGIITDEPERALQIVKANGKH